MTSQVYAFPMSSGQRRLWLLHRMRPDSPAYNITAGLTLRGDLDADLLQRALDEVVARHEILRTRFEVCEGEAMQVVAEEGTIPLRRVDLRHLEPAPRERAAAAHAAREVRHLFDLSRAPLLRVTLLRMAEDEHRVLTVLHHVIGDGWSMGVLHRELSGLYASLAAGRPAHLPELPLQYADYSEWQRELLRGPRLERLESFWKQALEGAPRELELPLDRPRRRPRALRGGVVSFEVPADTARALERLAHERGATLYVVLLAAFGVLLSRRSGQRDLAVGTPVAGRSRPEFEPLIGFFLNTLVLRLDLAGAPSFLGLVERVGEVVLAAMDHSELPFERVVDLLDPPRDPGSSPLFQVLFVLQNTPPSREELPGLEVRPLALERSTTQFDLSLSMQERPGGGIEAAFEFDAELFDRATVEGYARELLGILETFSRDPARRIEDREPGRGPEASGHATGPCEVPSPFRDLGARTLVEAFLRHLEERPDAAACAGGGESLSYRQLASRAGSLATRLRDHGVGPEVPVALLLEPGLDVVVAILGTLLAGGFYVPIETSTPAQRAAFVLADSGARVLLTARERRHEASELAGGEVVVLSVDAPGEASDPSCRTPGEPGGSRSTLLPENAAYMIYTSGTTGRPKGVVVTHENVLRLFEATAEAVSVGPDDVWSVFHSYAFDFSVWEIFGALLHGGRMVMVPRPVSRDPPGFWRLLCQEGVTVLSQTPSAFRNLLDTDATRSGASGVTHALRYVVFGGEALEPSVLAPWFHRHPEDRPRLVNMYGITETTVHVTWRHLERRSARERGSFLGRALDDLSLRVVDAELRPLPPGTPGEILVGGAGVSRGYHRRPGLTAERFVPDPDSATPGARRYRSGDLARRVGDGEVEYLGRIDHQVKIRGFRIELGEVEAALRQLAAVVDAVALARRGPGGEQELLAYVVWSPGGGLDPGELRRRLRDVLPEPMVPAHVVGIERLPLTPNGKLDRAGLPDPPRQRSTLAAEPLRTSLERRLAGAWEQVLEVEGVGRDSHFFDLGGNSLHAMRLVVRLERQEGLELALQTVFEHPTLARQAARVTPLNDSAGSFGDFVAQAGSARPGRIPLSHEQEGLWFLDRLYGASAAYNLPAAFLVRGRLDTEALGRALRDLALRHESLRTSFASEDGEPYQLIHAEPSISLEVEDLRGLAGAERGAVVQRRIADEALRPFTIEELPLFRVKLLALGEDETVLVSTFHHMVFDGWSTAILARELGALYTARATGAPAPTLPDPTQYAEYALWQRRAIAAQHVAEDLVYWSRHLAGIPAALDLPIDFPRRRRASPRGKLVEVRLDPDAGAWVATLVERSGATPFQVFLAAFAALLGRLTGAADIVVGAPVARRDSPEAGSILGFLVNTLLLRIDLGGNPSFGEALERTQEVCVQGLRHSRAPLHRVVEEVAAGRGASGDRVPFPQVLFAFQNLPAARLDIAGLGVQPLAVEEAVAKGDLAVSIEEDGEGYRARVEYDADLFRPGTIEQVVARLQVLLEDASRRPSTSVQELQVLSPSERRLLDEWSGESAVVESDACVHELFQAAARARPEAVATVAGGRRMTYRELDARANLVARRLVDAGVAPDDRVGLMVPRSHETIVGLLGILKAGGAYVPLDETNPPDRLARMFRDAAVQALVIGPGREHPIPFPVANDLPVLEVDRVGADFAAVEPPAVAVSADNLAYVSFTSGSTGRPKGVAIPHRGVVRLVRGANYARLDADQTYLQIATLSFDAATFEIWAALTTGARLVLMPPGLAPLDVVEEVIQANGVDTVLLTSGMFHLLIDERIGAFRGVTQLLAGGDVLSVPHVERVLREVPGCQVVNVYGPAENTTFTSCYRVDPGRQRGGSLPIGPAVGGTTVYVLDEDLEPVPVGVVGELYTGGAGLARGYLGQPARTAERFLPDPHGRVPGGRLYRTGDLARFLPRGHLEFLGRSDTQVKIRGIRVEPGEIEERLRGHRGVEDCVVVVAGEPGGDRRVVAYLVSPASQRPRPPDDELRAHARQALPDAMVPAAFVWLEALPLDVNGKVDRRALPEPEAASELASATPPRTDLERRVAAIWAEVLGRESRSVHANFFDSGGHSLLATRVVTRLRERVHADLLLASLFEHPTIAELAAHIGRLQDASPPPPSGARGAREEFEI